MDEHYALLDEGVLLTEAVRSGDLALAESLFRLLAEHLSTHTRREEEGIFTALRDMDEFTEEVDTLEQEHVDLDALIAGLDVTDADFPSALAALLADLEEHTERENVGIFPVSVVTLGADGWDTVERAREVRPTFLGAQDSRA